MMVLTIVTEASTANTHGNIDSGSVVTHVPGTGRGRSVISVASRTLLFRMMVAVIGGWEVKSVHRERKEVS